MNKTQAATLVAEFALLAGIVGGFLVLYIEAIAADPSVVLAHAPIVLGLWSLSIALRLLVWRFLPESTPARMLASIAIAVPLIALSSWYLLILISLDAWGRVITWAIAKSYAPNVLHLLATLGYQPLTAMLCLAAAVLVPVALIFLVFSQNDWMRRFSRSRSRSGAAAIVIVLLAVPSAVWARLIILGSSHPQEPFSLSFSPASGRHLQTHVLPASSRLNAAELRERSRLVVSMSQARPNIILIVGDALRASHMSIYGYARPTTPRLEQVLASSNGHLVAQARSVCAESLCGLLALATSRPIHLMPSNPISLSEVLRINGYAVHMILSGDHANFYDLRDLYRNASSYHDGSGQTAHYLNDDELVLAKLDTVQRFDGRPTMIQFHLMSTHGLGRRHAEHRIFQPDDNYYSWPVAGGYRDAPSDEAALAGVNYYDNGVRQLDYYVTAILQRLQTLGYLDHALVVLTGDHGEMLGEHGHFGHQKRVEEPALTIPLVLLRFGYEGQAFQATFASQVDIAPTVLRELNLAAPDTWIGRPLHEPDTARRVPFQQGWMAGLYDSAGGRLYKFWADSRGGKEYVYDLTADPQESANIVAAVDPVLLAQWRSEILATRFVKAVAFD